MKRESEAARRGRFEGVWKIVQFNWPFYAAAAVSVMVLLVLFARTAEAAPFFAGAALIVAGAMALGVLVSLLVSHWVYDRSALCAWKWMREIFADPGRAANVHAGFDETTAALRALFPRTRFVALDFYDPAQSTEKSIRRARRAYPPAGDVQKIRASCWGLSDASCDALFLLFAAHELRTRDDRVLFFREARRVLVPKGKGVLVEHLRDLPNFLAFGPGCLHFFSRNDWLATFGAAGLRVAREFAITPFVRVFVLERDDQSG